MRLKTVIVLPLTFVVGSILGLTLGFYEVHANRYFDFSMLRSIAQIVLKSWNYWAVVFLLATIVLLLIVLGWKIGWRLFFSNTVEFKDPKRVVAFFIFLSLFLSIGFAANKYWLPYRFHPKSLLADFGIFLFSLFVAWIVLKRKWDIEKRILNHIWKIAVPLACIQILFNGVMILDKRPHNPRPPNVVWILVDALRADHLGCYGYHRETSPFIDEFARKGILFKNAYSQETYTLASVASFFTSTYPTFHRVLYNNPTFDRLDRKLLTIAEVLRDQNYKTAAFFFNPHFKAGSEFEQGFEVYEEVEPIEAEYRIPMYIRHETASLINKKTDNYLRKTEADHRPAFLYLHVLDVHSPYAPPPPYDKLFLPPEYHPHSDVLEERPFCLKSEGDWCIALYDGGIRYTDSQLKKIMTMLSKHGINYDNTIFIVSADHGEEFFDEHPNDIGGYLHGRTLYQEQIHVPLILSIPDKKAVQKVVDSSVQSIDIVPTILDVIGVDWKKYRQLQGKSLLPLIKGNSKVHNSIFSGGNHGRGVVIKDNWKLYEYDVHCKQNRLDCFKTPSTYGGKNIRARELYNLKVDPRETKNLYESEPQIATELQKVLAAFLKLSMPYKDQRSTEVDEETLEELKSLGYLD